jgi:signal peptidase I
MMTSPLDASASQPARAAFSRRAVVLLATVVGPAIASPLILRYLFPSPLAGASGGVAGLLSWVGDRYPLFAGLAIFLVLSETVRYWMGRLAPRLSSRPDAVLGSSPRSARRVLAILAAVAIAAFVIRSSFVATYRIAGPSMLPTLEMGDRVLVNRLAYGLPIPFTKARLGRRFPQRGDLVVFGAEGRTKADGPQSLVKRIVGLPGDRISFESGTLIVNDWRVPSCDAGPYLAMDGRFTVRGRLAVEFLGSATYLTVHTPTERPFGGYTVKEGEVFVMGDDRGMSTDSRAWNEGRGAGVPVDILDGRVSRVLFGARLDHRLDFSRLLATPLDLEVRMPGLDMQKTEQRINHCLAQRPAMTSPPSSAMSVAPGLSASSAPNVPGDSATGTSP